MVPSSSRTTVAVALSVWVGALGGRWFGWRGLVVGAAAAFVLGGVLRRVGQPAGAGTFLVAGFVLIGVWSGLSSVEREAEILGFVAQPRPVDATLRMLTDPRSGDFGWWALARFDPPRPPRPPSVPVLLAFADEPVVEAGEAIFVSGSMGSRSGRAGGDPFAGVLSVKRFHTTDLGSAPWMAAGNAVRRRALALLRDGGPSRALLGGFLVGETEGIPDADMEAMRRSGLAHLVAVSGSNVALFLGLVLVALGPLTAGPRRRAVAGLLALAVLIVATRWEPSVVRAAVMAGLILAGRLGGWSLDGLSALATTATLVVAVSGEMAVDVGFVLSVLATTGVLVATRLTIEGVPRWMGATLLATLGAQIAVVPVLLSVFGSVPLMSPLINLVAAPVVAASTAIGAIGVGVGAQPLIDLAAVGAGLVLAVARVSSDWPQLGWGGVAIAAGLVAAGSLKAWRPVTAVVGGTMLIVVLLAGGGDLPRPGAVVLDVGQGDAIVVVSSEGKVLLVDGGPDPAVLDVKLSRYGVGRVDLVVLSHVHADHAAGLAAVLGRRPVGEIWFPSAPHTTPAAEEIRSLATQAVVPLKQAPVGERVSLGDLEIEVLGPVRRYASANDQSIVLRVRVGNGPRLLLTGDIETFAQDDLRGVTAEYLKVPHQGGGTSDLDWLAGTEAVQAVISVGPNEYGHPDPGVVAALATAGMRVVRTDVTGDYVIPLG